MIDEILRSLAVAFITSGVMMVVNVRVIGVKLDRLSKDHAELRKAFDRFKDRFLSI